MYDNVKKYWKVVLTGVVAAAALIFASFLPRVANAQEAADVAAKAQEDNGHKSVCFITSPDDAGLLDKFKATAKEFGCTVGTWFSSGPEDSTASGDSKPTPPTGVNATQLEPDEDHQS